MQALMVADITELYWNKFRLENNMIADRLHHHQRDDHDMLKRQPVWEPASSEWNLLIRLNASLDEEIAAKVKLLIQLKSFSASDPSPDDESSLNGESTCAAELDQEEPSENEAQTANGQGLTEAAKIEGTNPPSATESII